MSAQSKRESRICLDPPGYEARVRQLEAEGLTRSDAQGAADVEVLKGTLEASLRKYLFQGEQI